MNYKTAVLPILTALAGAITLIFKINIPHDTIDFLASIIGILIFAGVNIWGIIKNHKTEGKVNDSINENEK